MKKLNLPELNPNDIFEILMNNAKFNEKKDRLRELKEYIFARYSVYQEHSLMLEAISESDIHKEDDKQILHSCYNRNKNGYLEGQIVATIIDIQSVQHKNKCPYCGIDRPRTIDHYLPKSDFPEFSVFPFNLIPCCQYCNGKKNDRWLKNGKRMFLNFYYDEIPQYKFLYTNLVFSNTRTPIITFSIEENANISADLFEIIQEHYINLNLLKEYALSVDEEISSIHDQIIKNDVSIDQHKEMIKRQLDTSIRKFGVNYWRSSFLDALLDCDEFFENTSNIKVS